MRRLADRLKALIAETGPLSVADYMAHCLFDPQDGYYTTREPFGTNGDFITAPEISQMFGELVGAWLLHAAAALGHPDKLLLAEIGPGRGTLMKDILRTVRSLDPALAARLPVAMVETSPRLVEIQKQVLASSGFSMSWHETLSSLPPRALLLVGNEIFDAVPIRQFVKLGGNWHERVVALDEGGELIFAAGPAGVDPALLPKDADHAPDGAVIELSPARAGLMEAVSGHLAAHGGAALFFDYGHLEPGIGDTLQAMRAHAYVEVLQAPGEADLTAHVDFAALSQVARARGLETAATTQGEFLLALGLLERAGRLGSGKSATEQDAVRAAVERLAGPDQMGSLFKVMAIHAPGLVLLGFAGGD